MKLTWPARPKYTTTQQLDRQKTWKPKCGTMPIESAMVVHTDTYDGVNVPPPNFKAIFNGKVVSRHSTLNAAQRAVDALWKQALPTSTHTPGGKREPRSRRENGNPRSRSAGQSG